MKKRVRAGEGRENFNGGLYKGQIREKRGGGKTGGGEDIKQFNFQDIP